MQEPLHYVRYAFERFIIRGPLFRLLAMAGIIVTIAVTGGLVVWLAGLFEAPQDAIWWAFLRLTDPGYLGDDEGILKRVVSTTITILGYVVFMGALIAVMTQWFHETMNRIQAGVTPVSLKNHFVVLGWTNRSAAIVRELAVSESRVRRFYQKLGTSDELRIVVLADHDADEVREELRRALGTLYSPNRIIVRVGSALRGEHIDRVDFLRSAAAILPADPETAERPANVDALTIKTLMSILHAAKEADDDVELPLIVAELTDDRKLKIAHSAYTGPLETLATDRIIARLIAQNVRHRGLSRVFGELLGHEYGSEIYVRDWHGSTTTFREVASSFRGAIPIGIVRVASGSLRTELRPPLSTEVRRDDRVVMVAASYAATEATSATKTFEGIEDETSNVAEAPGTRRILLLGWNRKVPVLLDEFDQYEAERFEVDVVSMVSTREREREIDRRVGTLEHTSVTHHVADFTSEDDLADFALPDYDNILIVGSDWLESDSISDARSLLGHLVVHAALEEVAEAQRPDVVVELLTPENADLLREYKDDVIVSPMIVSHMLTHIALRRELGVVFSELFGPHGAEIFLRPIGHYGLGAGDISFEDVRRRVAFLRDVAIGIEVDGNVVLNPEDARTYTLGENDRIIALTAY